MGRITAETTIESKLPVAISFTCAKCGREVESKADIFLERTESGIVDETHAKLMGLPKDASNQIELIANFVKKNSYLQPFSNIFGSKFPHPPVSYRCPYCNTVQLPDAGGERKSLAGSSINDGRFKGAGILLILAWFALCMFFLFRDPINYLGMLIATLVTVAGYIGMFKFSKRNMKNAWDNPDYLYEKYHSVINPEVYVDFTPYGFGKVLANSEKYEKLSMNEIKERAKERAARQDGDGR